MRTKTTNKEKGFYLRVNEKVHQEFKVKCVMNGENMTDVFEKFMIDYAKKK